MSRIVRALATSFVGRWYANDTTRFGRYGKVLKLEIDPKACRINLSVLLKGEDRPIEIQDAAYRLHKTAQGTEFELLSMQCSRAWIETAAADFLVGERFSVPEPWATRLDWVL